MLIKSCFVSQSEEDFQRLWFFRPSHQWTCHQEATSPKEMILSSQPSSGSPLCRKKGAFKEYPCPPTENGEKGWPPATVQMQCRSEERDSVVVSISFTASTSRNIHTAIKHTFTQKTWKWEEPKPNQTFRRSKSKFKGIALFCELHATVLYGNRRLRACLLKCCSQRQSGNIRSLWL